MSITSKEMTNAIYYTDFSIESAHYSYTLRCVHFFNQYMLRITLSYNLFGIALSKVKDGNNGKYTKDIISCFGEVRNDVNMIRKHNISKEANVEKLVKELYHKFYGI